MTCVEKLVASLSSSLRTRADLWGMGIVQNLDAVATELYVGHRNLSPEVETLAGREPSIR